MFAASDFGRTFASNGSGTDHAWGNHHFVVGGAAWRGMRSSAAKPSPPADQTRSHAATPPPASSRPRRTIAPVRRPAGRWR
ncbi:DUF1501 domain-containing protein, partial [Escherichia coli]|uniref:DUF1501 domain-containing protein n=1 Tax=Escherichia coli TaxID=562 RepID=UPI0034D1A22B